MVGEQVAGVQFVLGCPSVKFLVRRPDRIAALDEVRDLRPHLGINTHPVFGQDADVLT